MFERLTEDVLRHAGIGAGMRVLDIGCGLGDVSFLAARMVGPSGSVVGIDRGDELIETARRRAKGLGDRECDLRRCGPFGLRDQRNIRRDHRQARFALSARSVESPSAPVREFAAPDGVVAFQEMDMSTFLPPGAAPLITRALTWVYEAFGAAGAQREMGPRLPDIFMNAGLPAPRNDGRPKGDEWIRS